MGNVQQSRFVSVSGFLLNYPQALTRTWLPAHRDSTYRLLVHALACLTWSILDDDKTTQESSCVVYPLAVIRFTQVRQS